MRKLLFLLLPVILWNFAYGTDTLRVGNGQSARLTNKYFSQLEDRGAKLTIAQVATGSGFHVTKTSLPFIKYIDSALWVKFILKNETSQPYIPISINSSVIGSFELYTANARGEVISHLSSLNGKDRKMGVTQDSRVINCPLLPDSVRIIYLRIKSNDSMVIPITVQSADLYLSSSIAENLTIGFFLGIVVIMTLYNLMLYLIVGDRSYLFYVFYIIFLGITQSLNKGVGIHIFRMDQLLLTDYILPLSRIFFWYAILLFVHEFLQLKQNLPQRLHRYYFLLYLFISIPLVFILLNHTTIAYSLITSAALTNSFVLIGIGIMLYMKGFKPAKFFMLGWGLFLITVVATVARNKGLIKYNDFTANFILYSSAFELIMFSVALADRINFYRKQNAEAQSKALTIARENERLITSQNFILENKVKERTQELIESNQNLSVTIENLKSAQMQLIDTEKMASLGQLTAGIAHEINNPINFVSANVKPLRMDFAEVFALLDMYRQLDDDPTNTDLYDEIVTYARQIDIDFIRTEIGTLLDGIEDGASRTAEIVQGLRTFSRTDEPTLKQADINRSILTTLILLRSTIPYNIEIQPVLNKLPMIDCYPGKISQVLVNLINNSIQAIKAKPVHDNEHISITTQDFPDHIKIEISDTGIGMSDEVKQHIFDPFYTTKDIGEGTGLGLSIVFGIIDKHKGHIDVRSAPGQGSTFTVTLPKGLE